MLPHGASSAEPSPPPPAELSPWVTPQVTTVGGGQVGLQLHLGHAVWAEQLFSEAKGITRHIRWLWMLNNAPQDARLKPLTFIAQSGKESSCNAGDQGSIPGSGRSPGEGNGNPLQYSCLENPRDGGAWWAAVYGVAQVRTQLK